MTEGGRLPADVQREFRQDSDPFDLEASNMTALREIVVRVSHLILHQAWDFEM
jgi:hypothetical protein